MNDELQHLIDGYLDDQLSSEELLRLGSLVKVDAEIACRFARATLLHDRLRAEVQASMAPDESNARPSTAGQHSAGTKRWTMSVLAAAAALLLFGAFLWHGATVPSASAAVVALDRIIDAAAKPVDREYRIHVTYYGPSGARPPIFAPGGGRKPGIDGAELFVRGSDKFVLVRHFGDGAEFITGSNGIQGWAVPPSGHVHLSDDPRRFRRGVPGEHEEIPFVNLETSFAELRRGYELELIKPDQTDEQSKGQSRLVAVKKSVRRPGPDRVRISFDSAGVAHRIELSGLPPEEGGARGVVLELVGQRDLGPDFFLHQSHHDVNRPIDWE